MVRKCLIFVLVSGAFLVNSVVTAGPVEKGWEAFGQNQYEKARRLFQQATERASTRAKGYTGLFYVNWHRYNYEKGFENFRKFYKKSTSPYDLTEALWLSPVVMQGYGKKSGTKVEFLKHVIEDAGNHKRGRLEALARYTLGEHYISAGKADKARDVFEGINPLSGWQLTGPFQNVSGSGFYKNHDPLKHPRKDHVFTSKSGGKVHWFQTPGLPLHRWTYFDYFFSAPGSLFYAQTFVKSPGERTVQLRVGSSGTLKAWVNDSLVIKEREFRDSDIDAYIAEVKLKKGYNRILLQVGANKDPDKCNYIARLTDARGNPLKGFPSSAAYKNYSGKYNPEMERITFKAEKAMKDRVRTNPDRLVNRLLLAQVYLHNEKLDSALKQLLEAEKLAPDNYFIKGRLLHIYKKRGNDTRRTQTAQWLKEHDANNIFGLKYRFYEALKKERYDEAEKYLEVIGEKFGKKEDYYTYKIRLSNRREEISTLVSTVKEAYQKYPDNAVFVKFKYMIERKANKDIRAGLEVLKRFNSNNFHARLTEETAGCYFELGRKEKGIRVLERIPGIMPLATGYYYTIANKQFEMQAYKNALESINKALDMAPYVGAYWRMQGKILKAVEQKEEAVQAYEKSLQYQPLSYETRSTLRDLQQKMPVFELFENQYDPAEVTGIFEGAGKQSDFPGENSAVLASDVKRVVYSEGGSEALHTIIVKVFSKKGVDQWKEYAVLFNGNFQTADLLKAQVLKANGNKASAETDGNKIAFPSLEPGDGLVIRYKVKDYFNGRLMDNFWDKHYFSRYVPVKASRYSLLVPKGKQFDYQLINDNAKPDSNNKEDYELYTWHKEDISQVDAEDYMPPLTDVGQVLYLSDFSGWDAVSNWYWNLSRRKTYPSFEVQRKVQELLKDTTGLNDYAKARIFYDYIVNNIRYSSVDFRQSAFVPQSSAKTLNTKLGDCKDVSALFVAMCREAGLDANLVLVSRRNNGVPDLSLPSIYFDYCIAKLTAGGKGYYIDLTSDNYPMGAFPASLEKSFALEVAGENDAWYGRLNPDTRSKNITYREVSVCFQEDKMIVDRENYKTGSHAASMRELYRGQSDRKNRNELLKAVSKNYDGYVDLKELSFKNINNSRDTVFYDYTFAVEDPFKTVAGMNTLEIPFSDSYNSLDFLSNKEREYPLNFWQVDNSDRQYQKIIINFPENKKLLEVPDDKNINTSFGDYSLTFKKKEGQLVVIRRLALRQDVIDPGAYKAFKAFYKQVVDADNMQIAFR